MATVLRKCCGNRPLPPLCNSLPSPTEMNFPKTTNSGQLHLHVPVSHAGISIISIIDNPRNSLTALQFFLKGNCGWPDLGPHAAAVAATTTTSATTTTETTVAIHSISIDLTLQIHQQITN